MSESKEGLLKDTNRIYFEHLDVVRFISAFMIVFFHTYESWVGWFGQVGALSGGTYKDLTSGGKYVDTFFRNMGVGVDVFFLISGFLITYILLEEKKRHNKIHIGKFLIRRSLRIWPLYFLLIAITPTIVSWVGSYPEPNYWANLFFVGNFEVIRVESWTYPFGHFWSICVEEHFYLVWPFIIAFIPKKRLILVFVSLIIVSILFRIYTAATMELPWFTLFAHTLSRMDVLIIGAFGAYYYSEKPFTFKLKRSLRMLLVLTLIILFSLEPTVLWETVFMAGFRKYLYVGIITLLLLDFNFNSKFKHYLKRKSFIHYLGKVSYGIYMYHIFIIMIVIKKIMWEYEITNMWVFFSLSIGLSIIVPIISYELIEKHILKINKKFRVVPTKR